MKSIHLGKKKIVELTINDVEYIAALDNYANNLKRGYSYILFIF